jgi:hypothetical protein
MLSFFTLRQITNASIFTTGDRVDWDTNSGETLHSTLSNARKFTARWWFAQQLSGERPEFFTAKGTAIVKQLATANSKSLNAQN